MNSSYGGPPQWLVEIAIEPKSRADQQKLGAALTRLAAEDPSFHFSTDLESSQTILKGMSELHLDILRRTYKVDANIGAPQVAFRERVTRRAEVKYTHKKQTGGTGQFAEVSIVVEPNEPGKGYQFEPKIVGGAVPQKFIPAIKKGLESVLPPGVVAGFPVVDVKVPVGRRQVSRRRLLSAGVRNRLARGIPRSADQGQVRFA